MDPELVLGRVGHYFTPHGPDEGACQLAFVAYVHPPVPGVMSSVNLAGYEHDGEPFRHLDVVVDAPGPSRASFHLNRACPWSR